jgi:hypothetical protein
MSDVAWNQCLSRDCPSFGVCLLAYHGQGVPSGSFGHPWPGLRHPTIPGACVAFQQVPA